MENRLKVRRCKSAIALSLLLISVVTSLAADEKAARKHPRAQPPTFAAAAVDGIFYEDVAAQLTGALPRAAQRSAGATTAASGGDATATAESPWKALIEAATLEDLVKNSSKPLDVATSSPAKFAGGGYQTSRLEYIKLAILFGVIAEYPGDIRWKHSAHRAHQEFSRAAANGKAGSLQVYNESKAKKQLFNDLLNGTRLDAGSTTTFAWGEAIDRDASMQLLEWTLREAMAPAVGTDASFATDSAKVQQYAQLTAVVGQLLQRPEMADADSEEYRQLAQQMMSAATAVRTAAAEADHAAARLAISELDASCNRCHEVYR